MSPSSAECCPIWQVGEWIEEVHNGQIAPPNPTPAASQASLLPGTQAVLALLGLCEGRAAVPLAQVQLLRGRRCALQRLNRQHSTPSVAGHPLMPLV